MVWNAAAMMQRMSQTFAPVWKRFGFAGRASAVSGA